jgi:hypothetical protein
MRTGVAIHQWSPEYTIGCLSTLSGSDTKPVQDLMKAIPDLDKKDEPVNIILDERAAMITKHSNFKQNGWKWSGVEYNPNNIERHFYGGVKGSSRGGVSYGQDSDQK